MFRQASICSTSGSRTYLNTNPWAAVNILWGSFIWSRDNHETNVPVPTSHHYVSCKSD
jgi:hypothetical protein